MDHMSQVWEADYGDREPTLSGLRTILEDATAGALTGVMVFVNNNPYRLEYFVSMSYSTRHADADLTAARVAQIMREAGARERSDLDPDELIASIGAQRFNAISLTDARTVNLAEECFSWPSRSDLVARGYDHRPYGARSRVFLSHSSDAKPTVRRLRGLLQDRGLATWFDEVDIEAGEPLVTAIEDGIAGSKAVIFWVDRSFLQSRWCKYEMDGFFHRYADTGTFKLFTIVDSTVSHGELPSLLQRLKYLPAEQRDPARSAADSLTGPLKRHLGE